MASAAEEAVAVIRERLVATDVARADEIEGCSEPEMAEIRAINPRVAVPDVYLEFMRQMGRRTGYLFAGTDIRYPECVEYQDDIRDFATEDPTFRPDDWFVFAVHQGYQFYYFRDADPRVYVHSEGEDNPFLEYDSFTDLIDSEITNAAAFITGYRERNHQAT